MAVIFTKSLAEYLAIEESELGFGIKKYKGYLTIFIYDTAKGGAGYASQFNMYTEQILKQAFEVLDNCSCQTACTKCLIDRSTQWHIEDLDRHLAIDWLKASIDNQLPIELISEKIKVTSIFGNLNDEIKSLNYHYGINEINIHINNKISEWEIDQLDWLENLKRDRININLIVEGDITYANNQEKLSAYLLSHNYNLKIGTNIQILNYPIKLTIVKKNGDRVAYISKSDYASLDSVWENDAKKKCYKVEEVKSTKYVDYSLPKFDASNLYESRVNAIPSRSQSNDLAKLMIENLNNSNDLLSKIKNKTFRVSYIDKYNQSEFSMRLLLQFLNQLQAICSLEIEELAVNLTKEAFKSRDYPRSIIDNYKDFEDYKYDLEQLSNAYGFGVTLVDVSRLPHYRYFEFKSDEISFTIRIDAGIAHGFRPYKFLKSEEMKFENQIFEIIKYVHHDIIYNISLED